MPTRLSSLVILLSHPNHSHSVDPLRRRATHLVPIPTKALYKTSLRIGLNCALLSNYASIRTITRRRSRRRKRKPVVTKYRSIIRQTKTKNLT